MAHFTAALYTKLERFEDRSDGAPTGPNGKNAIGETRSASMSRATCTG